MGSKIHRGMVPQGPSKGANGCPNGVNDIYVRHGSIGWLACNTGYGQWADFHSDPSRGNQGLGARQALLEDLADKTSRVHAPRHDPRQRMERKVEDVGA